MSLSKRSIGTMALVTVLLLTVGEAAQAQPERPSIGLRFYNRTNEEISIAIMYIIRPGSGNVEATNFERDTWVVKGWYNIPANRWLTVVDGNLTNRYYYYHAESKSRTWADNKVNAPVLNGSKFEYEYLTGEESGLNKRFANKGFVSKGFKTINTGDSREFIQPLDP